MRKLLTAAVLGAAFTVSVATPALALDCTNNSRPAPDIAGVTPTQVDTITDADGNPIGGIYLYELVGNWAYIDAQVYSQDHFEWTFVPPGTVPLAPDAHGNYQAGDGFGLLDMSAAVCVGRTNHPGMHGVTADPFTTSVAQPCRQ